MGAIRQGRTYDHEQQNQSSHQSSSPQEPKYAKEFMSTIEEDFQSSNKTDTSTLMMKMLNAKYNGQGSDREHILKLVDIA